MKFAQYLIFIIVICFSSWSPLRAQIENVRIGQEKQTVLTFIHGDMNASTYKIIKTSEKVQFVSSVNPQSLWEYQFQGSRLKKILVVSSYNPVQQLKSIINMGIQYNGHPKRIQEGKITKYYWNIPGKGLTYLYNAYHSYYKANCMITEKISE